MSGWQVVDNTVIDAQMGLMVGGGRDTIVSGNRFVGCDVAVHVDNRGMGGELDLCNGSMDALKAMLAGAPAWGKYGITTGHQCIPENNTVSDNCWTNCGTFFDHSAPPGATMAEQARDALILSARLPEYCCTS